MEFMAMDSSLQPYRLIEDFDSLVWTERYSRSGDFELVSSNVEFIFAMLPLETLVALRSSNVPMIVEAIKVSKGISEGPKVTVSGRSFETVLDRRASVNSLPPVIDPSVPKQPWVIRSAKESDAAYKDMRAVLGDIERHVAPGVTLPAIPPGALASPLDVIPIIDLIPPSDYQPEAGTTWYDYEIRPGDLYSTALDLINVAHRGLRAARPAYGESKIRIEVYNGADISSNYVLDARFDQLDSATYLFSHQNSANVAYVYGPTGSGRVLKNAFASEPSGLNRRVIAIDDSGDERLNDEDVRRSRGLVELYKKNSTSLFDGQASYQIAAGYNQDYFLGDIISLVGEYNVSTKVRVAEFIRTQDASGEKAFPAFEVVDEFN